MFEECQLKWFGHAFCMTDERKFKQTLKTKVKEKTRRKTKE